MHFSKPRFHTASIMPMAQRAKQNAPTSNERQSSQKNQMGDPKIKLPGSECQTSGTSTKRAKQATKKDNTAACSCLLNYLAFLRPMADRAVSMVPWVVSRGRSHGFLWAFLGWFDYSKKCEVGQFNSGLFASKQSKASYGAC
jgi:hypothetical protein